LCLQKFKSRLVSGNICCSSNQSLFTFPNTV
jgi:hypothetical protein